MEVLLTKEYIEQLLEERKISKAEFAAALGIQRTNLDALLKANKKDINTTIKMANILGMTLEEFIGFDENKFNIQGFIKVNSSLMEIKTADDWFAAEKESGVATIQYFKSLDDVERYVREWTSAAIEEDRATSIMGRIGPDVVFNISVIDDGSTVPLNTKSEKTIILSMTSARFGNKTYTFSTFENEGDYEFMYTDIIGCLEQPFQNTKE